MELTLELIQALAKLMVEQKIDRIKYGELEMLKTKHEVPKANNNSPSMSGPMTEEELLFYSTTAPALTMEQVEALAINPPRRNKKAKS